MDNAAPSIAPTQSPHLYTYVPTSVLRDGSLSPGARALYVLLLSYAQVGGKGPTGRYVDASQPNLGAHLGTCKETVGKYARELVARSLVSIEDGEAGRPFRYAICPLPKQWRPTP